MDEDYKVFPVVKCRACGECFVMETKMDPMHPRLGYVLRPEKDKDIHNCPCESEIKIDENKYFNLRLLLDVIGYVREKEKPNNNNNDYEVYGEDC